MSEESKANTDKEIWRKIEGDYYSPCIFETIDKQIGINVGGRVISMSIEKWHELAVKHCDEMRGEKP